MTSDRKKITQPANEREELAERIPASSGSSDCSSAELPYGMDREQLTRFVLEWCWLSSDCPAGVHDAAAILLGEPSMAPGFANIQFQKWIASRTVESLKPPMQKQITVR